MSITDDLKGYADTAVESGRAVLNDGITQARTAVNEGLTDLRTAVDESIDGAGERAGKLAESATGVTTHAINRARYNAYAAVGAGDLAVTTLITKAQELPSDVVGVVTRVQNTATDLAEKVQTRIVDLAGKAGDVVGSAQGTVDGVRDGSLVEQLVGQAREARETALTQANRRRAELFNRGEHVVAEIRKDPRLQRASGLVEAATDTVTEAVAYPARRRAGEKAAATRARNARATKAAATRARTSSTTTAAKSGTASTAKSAPARKSTARKTTARKTATKSAG